MVQDYSILLNHTRLTKSIHLDGEGADIYVEECSRAIEVNGNYLGMEFLAPKNIFLSLNVDVLNAIRNF